MTKRDSTTQVDDERRRAGCRRLSDDAGTLIDQLAHLEEQLLRASSPYDAQSGELLSLARAIELDELLDRIEIDYNKTMICLQHGAEYAAGGSSCKDFQDTWHAVRLRYEGCLDQRRTLRVRIKLRAAELERAIDG